MTLPITIPNTFATATGNISLSLLDANFTTVANGINGIGNGTNTLTAPVITGGNISLLALGTPGASGNVLMSNGTSWVSNATSQKVLQNYYATNANYSTITSTIAFTDAVPGNTAGGQVFSTSFTPTSATSKVRIRCAIGLASSTGTVNCVLAVFSGNTSTASAVSSFSATTAISMGYLEYEEASANTNARTYSVRAGGDGTVYLNGISSGRKYGGALQATLVIEEINQ